MLSYRERQKLIEEQRLWAKLVEPPRAPQTSFWKILNAPITLWLLSSVAIALISATFTEHQSCIRGFEKDSLDFKKLSDEIPGRNKLLYRKLSEAKDESEYNQLVEQFKSGEAFFIYSELKGKSIAELSLTRSNLAKKLHPKWVGKNLLVCQVPRSGATVCHPVDSVPSVERETEPRDGNSNAASPIPWHVPDARGVGADAEYFKFLRDDAYKAFVAFDTPSAYVDTGEYWEIPRRCSLVNVWSRLLGF